MKGYVYHIKDSSSKTEGYVGVTKESKGISKRFREHINSKAKVGVMIRSLNLSLEDVDILLHDDISICYELEKELRPHQNIGWNVASGGGGPYYSSIKDLNQLRSDNQTERMKDRKLINKQIKTFKENYYASPEAQEHRSKKAKEHMADGNKKAACLASMHKKIKCPHCDFQSNAGNISQHIKRKHNDN